MRYITLFAMLSLFSYCKIQQPTAYKIRGVVVEEYTSEPIENVKIYDDSVYLGKTDKQGNFEVETFKTGDFFLTFKYFDSKVVTITVIEKGTENYDLRRIRIEGLTKAKFLSKSNE